MKIRHSFILVFTVSLFIPIAIPLVNSAWSEAVLGVAGSGVPIILDGGDFSGDGADDLSIFTPRGGVWRIRGLTAAYFGREGDYPAAGDYDGDGISDIAVFRPESGLWAVRGTTRFYFGLSGDLPAARDYAGDGVREPAVFRPRTGIWAIRGVEPIPFGREGDLPVPADYTGDGSAGIGVFRPATGLWAIRGLTRVYFGRPGDLPVPGDYLGEGTSGLAIYRASSGLWAIRRFTRVYFGGPGFIPAPLYYTGSEAFRIAVYDPARGLWAIRGVTRLYSGRTGGVPIPGYYLSGEPAEKFAPPEIRGGGTPEPTSTPEPTATPAPTAIPALTSTATPTPIPTPTIPLLDEGFDFFHQGRRPEGWIFNNCDSDTDTYLTSGNYGRKPPSLKLDATDDAVITSEFSRPEELTFWLKGQGTDATSALLVDEYDGADWHRLTDIYSLPTSGTDFPALALNPSTSQVKFTYLKSTGNLAFDDVRISEPATPSPVPTATAIPTPSFSPTPTVAPTATPSPSTTATPVPSATPSPTISPVPSASPSPSPIPWDGGMLENAGFESWTESDAYYWSWDGPSDQWLRSEDCYYEVYAGRFRREAATEGNLDQFGKSMIQGVTYFAVLMAKGTGEIRLGIRYPHTAYSSYGDWTVFSSAEWTLLEHQASPPGSGSEGGLRIQVRSCYEPYLVIDNAYLADIPLFPTPTTTPTPPPTATPTVTPTPFGVVINEIIYNPVGADAGQEWIELYNTSGIEKILTGHCLRLNVSSTPYQFPEYTLGAYSYVIVHTNAVGTDTATELYSPAPIANMGNTSGSVSFCNGNPPAAGNLIDFVQYGAGGQTWESSAVTAGIWSEGDFVPTVSEGHSMGRNPNGWDTDLSEDWMEFYVPTGGEENLIIPTPSPTAQPTATPSPVPEDNEGPQISWQIDSYPDYLEITGTAADLLSNINSVYFQIAAFHEGTDEECSYWLPVSTNPCLPDDGSFNSLTEDFLAILDTTYFHCEYGRYFEAVSQISASDSAGNWTVVTTFGPEAGWNTLCPNACNGYWEPEDLPRVIINEFMANPEGSEPANEWIELLNPNPSSSQVLLSGWTLGDAATPGETSAYAGIFTFPSSPPVYLAGGEYLVLGGSSAAAGGNVDIVYNLTANTQGTIQLGNTEDRIILRDAEGRLVDEVRYDSTWKIREGESLARKTVVRLADFVELYNKSGDEINLAGLYLSKGTTPSIVVPYSTATAVISPYSYGLVFGSLFPQELYPDLPAEVLVVTVDNADISGGIGVDDHLTLIEGATQVDTFHPDNVIGGARPQLGQSVERVDPEVGDILGNWELNEDYGSTPGAENSVIP